MHGINIAYQLHFNQNIFYTAFLLRTFVQTIIIHVLNNVRIIKNIFIILLYLCCSVERDSLRERERHARAQMSSQGNEIQEGVPMFRPPVKVSLHPSNSYSLVLRTLQLLILMRFPS